MRAIIQRVEKASVLILEQENAKIEHGLLVLLGVEIGDEKEDALWLSGKISGLRIFADENGVMNKSIVESGGEVIVVSQFTLHAKTKKGNRPSYIKVARPDQAIPLYERFKDYLALAIGTQVQSGEFGADMKISLINGGPVTILIDTKNKE